MGDRTDSKIVLKKNEHGYRVQLVFNAFIELIIKKIREKHAAGSLVVFTSPTFKAISSLTCQVHTFRLKLPSPVLG